METRLAVGKIRVDELRRQMHLEEVEALPVADRGLLRRPSPWYVRTRLALRTWLSRFRGNAHRFSHLDCRYILILIVALQSASPPGATATTIVIS